MKKASVSTRLHVAFIMRKKWDESGIELGKNVVLMPFHMIFGDAFSYISEGAFMPRFIYSHCIPSIYASLFFFENHSISTANIHSLSYWLGYFESSVNFSVWLEFTVWHSDFKWHFCKHFYAGSILHLNHQGWILFFSEIELGCKLPISKHRGSCYGLKQLYMHLLRFQKFVSFLPYPTECRRISIPKNGTIKDHIYRKHFHENFCKIKSLIIKVFWSTTSHYTSIKLFRTFLRCFHTCVYQIHIRWQSKKRHFRDLWNVIKYYFWKKNLQYYKTCQNGPTYKYMAAVFRPIVGKINAGNYRCFCVDPCVYRQQYFPTEKNGSLRGKFIICSSAFWQKISTCWE